MDENSSMAKRADYNVGVAISSITPSWIMTTIHGCRNPLRARPFHRQQRHSDETSDGVTGSTSASRESVFANLPALVNMDVLPREALTDAHTRQHDLDLFWQMLDETALRDKFHTHTRDYYGKMLELLSPEKNAGMKVRLYFAEFGGRAIASAMTPSSAPCRSSPSSKRERKLCSSTVASANNLPSVRRRSSPEPLPLIVLSVIRSP